MNVSVSEAQDLIKQNYNITKELIAKNKSEKRSIKALPNGVFKIRSKDKLFRMIVNDWDYSLDLEAKELESRPGLSYHRLPLDVLRGYMQFLYTGSINGEIKREIVLDYANARYSLLLTTPCGINDEIFDGICSEIFFEYHPKAGKRRARESSKQGYENMLEYIGKIAEVASKICADAKVYYEEKKEEVWGFIDYSDGNIHVSMPLSCNAEEVSSVIFAMELLQKDKDLSVEEIIEKMNDDDLDYGFYDVGDSYGLYTGASSSDPATPRFSYFVFTNESEKVVAKCLHYNGEDNTVDPREWMPSVIQHCLVDNKKYDGAKPNSLLDAAWIVLMACCGFGWEFVSENDIPKNAEVLSFDLGFSLK